MDLLENLVWKPALFLIRFSFGRVVFRDGQILPLLTPKLLMLHWQDHCSLNGVTSRELFLIVLIFLLHFDVLLMMYSTLNYWVVQFLSMKYVCLVFQLDLVAWLSVIRENLLV